MKDTLYQAPSAKIAPFEFDDAVVQIFEDMITRSVPGYGASIELAMVLALAHCKPQSLVYDLGCSLGACSLAIALHEQMPRLNIHAIDLSEPMLMGLTTRLDRLSESKPQPGFPASYEAFGPQHHNLKVILANITDYPLEPSSLVLLNYVLQFVALDQRDALISAIYTSLEQGGALLLSEKVQLADQNEQTKIDRLHQNFKRLQGYSELEIHAKRTALENVLVPETFESHKKRLYKAGFSSVVAVGYHLNFMHILAVK